MNTEKNSLPDPQLVLQDMLDSGEIDYGIMRDALLDTPESQAEFDKNEKGKSPVLED